jgi:hypothetical protein
MPGSIPRRKEILFQLASLEVWKAEKLFLGWGVERIDPLSGERFQEGHFDDDDDGLRALVVPSTKGLKIYLKDDPVSSFLPLELAEQLAAFCGVPEYESLMLFILSQETPSHINDALNRRGILSIEERQNELEKEESKKSSTTAAPEGVSKHEDLELNNQFRDTKGPEKSVGEKWIGLDDNHQKDEDLEVVTGTEDEDSDPGSSQSKHLLRDLVRRASQFANKASSQNERIEHQVAPIEPSEQWRFPLPQRKINQQMSPEVSIPNRPKRFPSKKAPGAREYVRALEEHSTRKRQARSTVETNGLGMFERPRIVDPTVIWVPSSQELPAENFSDRTSEGIVFPGRAQISQSGDCTIFLAKEPTNMIDTYTEFLGELFVGFTHNNQRCPKLSLMFVGLKTPRKVSWPKLQT